MVLRQRRRNLNHPDASEGSVKSEAENSFYSEKELSRSSKDTASEELDDSESADGTSHSDENELEEVMRDNLDLMLEIVMRIREDRDFASNIYAECPRLQHLLDQHPGTCLICLWMTEEERIFAEILCISCVVASHVFFSLAIWSIFLNKISTPKSEIDVQ